jgi:predicted SAM-dependent methyltransferase
MTKTNIKLLNLGCGSRYHRDWINIDFVSSSSDVISYDLTGRLPFSESEIDVVYHSHLLEHFRKDHALYFLTECFRILKPGGIIRVAVPDLEQIVRAYLELLDNSLKDDEIAKKRYDWIMIEMLDQMVRNQSGGNMLKYWRQNPMPAEDFVIQRVGSEALNFMNQVRNSMPDIVVKGQSSSKENDPFEIGVFRLSGEVHQWMYDRYSLKVLLEQAGFKKISQRSADESSIKDFNSYFLDIKSDGSVRKPDSLFMEAVKSER